MGLNYALVAVCHLHDAESLLSELRKLVNSYSQKWLANQDLLNWHECYTPHLLLDIQLEQHLQKKFDIGAPFGDLYLRVEKGSKYVGVQLIAVTSDLSMALSESEGIHVLWAKLARECNAVIAYLDEEGGHAVQLFPHLGKLFDLPDHPWLYPSEEEFDDWVKKLHASNGV